MEPIIKEGHKQLLKSMLEKAESMNRKQRLNYFKDKPLLKKIWKREYGISFN